jgi:hypothetical protein
MAAKKKATPKVEGEVVKDDATTITPSVDDTTKEEVVTFDTTVNTDTTPEVTPDTTGATEGGADDANTGDETVTTNTDDDATPVDPEGTSEGSNDDDNKDGEVIPPSTDSETTPDDTEAPQDTENTTTYLEHSDDSNVNESAPVADDAEIKVGDDVVINPTCKTTVTGTEIPSFAYRNVYRVKKILPDRVVIACGLLTYGVKASDVNKA